MTAPVNFAKLSPRELRESKPRLSFNWRCPECKCEWVGGVTTAYHCGVYAVEIDYEIDDDEQEDN